MTIGERIKELRKRNDMTQEKLADYLCVSYQAVSKWECGLSSPDLSLIGPLTKLFHVSADELLGLTINNTDKRREELEKEERETWISGDLSKRYEIACTAVAEYPGEMKYLNWLAWCEAMRSFDFKDDNEYIAEQEKAIKHFQIVIENATDEKIKTSSVQGIVQYLSFRGRYDEAKKYAEMYPDNNGLSKDRVLLDCLQGEEKTKHYQKMLSNMLSEILNHISNYNFEACEAQEKILNAVITDGNYLYFNGYLMHNYCRRAAFYTSNGEYEKAIYHLQKALEYAIAADNADKENTVYRFTTPFLNQLEYNSDDFWRTGGTKYIEDFYETIKRAPYDQLRDREDFKKYFKI